MHKQQQQQQQQQQHQNDYKKQQQKQLIYLLDSIDINFVSGVVLNFILATLRKARQQCS